MQETTTIEKPASESTEPGSTVDRPSGVWPRYLAWMTAGFTLALLGWLALVMAQMGVPTFESNWIAGAWNKKVAYAQSISGPKIVIAGGSSGLFDDRASQIERATGMPCVNLALHAGLGIDFLLDIDQSMLKPGDIVVLGPEYEMYEPLGQPSDVLVDYVFSRDPAYLKTLPAAERVDWMLALPPNRLTEGLLNKVRHRHIVDDETSVYRTSAIDAYGDEIGNLTSLQDPTQRYRVSLILPSETVMQHQPAADSLARIDRFIDWCHGHGVTVLMTYSPTIDFPEYHTSTARRFFDTLRGHYAAEGVPVLGTPYDFLYPSTDFYDTEYHMLSDTTTVNTNKLIGFLRPYLPHGKGAAPGDAATSTGIMGNQNDIPNQELLYAGRRSS